MSTLRSISGAWTLAQRPPTAGNPAGQSSAPRRGRRAATKIAAVLAMAAVTAMAASSVQAAAVVQPASARLSFQVHFIPGVPSLCDVTVVTLDIFGTFNHGVAPQSDCVIPASTDLGVLAGSLTTSPFLSGFGRPEYLLLGIAHFGTNPLSDHVSIFLDPTAAQNLAFNTEFSDLFKFLEPTIAADLIDLNAGANQVGNFLFDNATKDLRNLFDNFTGTGLFPVAGGPFTVVGFSKGQAIGSGTSTLEPVPEPATLALFGFGLVGLGVIRRRDKGGLSSAFAPTTHSKR